MGIARQLTTLAVLMLCFVINVGFVVQRDNHKATAAGSSPATVEHRAAAPNPRSNAPAASTRVSLPDVDTAAIGAATGDVVNSATQGINTAVDTVWDPALWLSNEILGYVADAWVNPVTGERVIFNATPAVFNLAVAILALAMVAIVIVALAGPIYAGWKTWRLSRVHFMR
jgi:hypothetical protein